jgi:allophanate hydrolase
VCLGRVELADGTVELGFVADTSALDDEDLTDITAFGGWRAYLAAH